MAKAEIMGSWFNSGYHGHHRSKSRLDFPNEYRHLAKPTPPWKFIRRLQSGTGDGSGKHQFSKHDNRQSFLNDALYFEEGLGRKRIPTKTNIYQPGFLAWLPHKQELDKTGPKMSTYKRDYHTVPNQPYKQQIVTKPRTSFDPDGQTTTTYRYAHGRDNPNKATLSAMSNDGLMSALTMRKPRVKTAWSHDSVASCMSWHVPKAPISASRTSVPTANHGALEKPPAMTQTATPAVERTCTAPETMVPTSPPMQPSPPATAPAPAVTMASAE